jgi:outer membrane protein assembly factor BamB
VLGAHSAAELGWDDVIRENHSRPQSAPPEKTGTDSSPPGRAKRRDGWTTKLAGWVCGPVAARRGSVAVTGLDGTVAILDAADGSPRPGWDESVSVGAALLAGPLLLGEDDLNTRVYVGAADGRVHEIGVVSRRDRVVVQAAAGIEGSPVVVDDWVCALSGDGRVHRVNARTGKALMLYEMGAAATGALCVIAGMIFAADADGWVHAIDAADGTRKWRQPTDGLVVSAPLPVADTLYVCGTDGVLREFGISDESQHVADKLGAAVHVTPTHDGSRLYVASSDGVVHAYLIGPDGLTRPKPLWQAAPGEEIAGLAAFRGRVYVAAGSRLVELNSVTGKERGLLRMDGLIGSPVIVADDCYVAGLDGSVVCIGLR